MLTSELPRDACPHCGRRTECASSFDGKVVTPGILVVCIACTGIAFLDENMKMRKPLPMEVERACDAATLALIRGYQKALVEFRKFYDVRKVNPA